MIDIPAIGKLLGVAVQIGQYFVKIFQWKKATDEKSDEEQMRTIVDELRRMARSNLTLIKPEIGSVQDQRCSRMVAKGYLARVQFGYMLPELVHHEGPESWC